MLQSHRISEIAKGKSLRVKGNETPEKGYLEAGTGGGSTGKLICYISAAILGQMCGAIPP